MAPPAAASDAAAEGEPSAPTSETPPSPNEPRPKSPPVTVDQAPFPTPNAPSADPTLMPSPATEPQQPPTSLPQAATDPTPPEPLATEPPATSPQPTLPTPPQARRAPARRTARNSRLGRPPNINENSLMRRLECVMAVDSGRMSMLTACQQYDISARTFYRWLRNKDRLIELTGFTEEDFRNNPPWGQTAAPPDASPNQPRAEPPDEIDLPRLPPQGTKAAAGAATASGMGMKRRFPKSTDARVAFQGEERPPSSTQAAFYARRSFTKMPSQSTVGGDVSAERAAARASTRMRRQDWPEGTRQAVDNRRFANEFGSRSNSPTDAKRRKVVRQGEDGQEEHVVVDAGEESPEAVGEFANGGAYQAGVQQGSPRGQVNGGRVDMDEYGKHRIEIMMGRRKVTIAWYEGASAEDIKMSIARRFALLPGTQWALIDKNFDEIVISAGVPSGRYTLTVFS